MTSAPRAILLTGATGTVGQAVMGALAARDDVTATVASRDVRRDRAAGMDAVPFDFARPETWAPALRGRDALFLLRPPAVTDGMAPLIDAARAAGVRHVVFVSVQGAERMPMIPHHRTEAALGRSGAGWTVLRPAYFMQNFLTALHDDLVERDEVAVPAGRAAFALIDVRDLGEAAARVLAEGAPHFGRAYVLTSDRRMTFAEMAAALSDGLGREVRYTAPSPPAFFAQRVRRGDPPAFAGVMTALHALPRLGAPPPLTGDVRLLTGHAPRSFEGFVRDHRAALSRPEIANPPAA